jgi:hypothetical protein
MSQTLNTRRSLVIFLSAVCIIVAFLLFQSSSEGFILAFFGLLLLGLLQYLTALYNTIRGSRTHGLYLLLSTLVLVAYYLGMAGFVEFPGSGTERGALNWAFYPGLIMGVIYTLVLIYDPWSGDSDKGSSRDDILDDDQIW